MTRVEANLLLDEIKNGINNYSNLAVTRALWVCGDLRNTDTRPYCILSGWRKHRVSNSTHGTG